MYEVRVTDGQTMLVDEKGEIGPLPEFFATQYRTATSLMIEDHGEEIIFDVWPRFTTRGEEPVLAIRPLNDEHLVLEEYVGKAALVFPQGPVGGRVALDRLDEFTDGPEWARQVIGVEKLETAYLGRWLRSQDTGALEAFRDELVRRCTEGSQHACELLDAAGVEPPIIEPDADPIAGDEHFGHDVASRDRETVEHLTAAAQSIRAALRTMPNSVDSAFDDPRADVRALEAALRDVEQVEAAARGKGVRV